MKTTKDIVIENLIKLRKKHKLTQLELAKKINYSDKAISRWEKGEVVPDINILDSICKVYNIHINYLFEEHNELEEKEDKQIANKLVVGIISICIVWTIITVAFVYIKIIYGYVYWQAFVWGIPISAIIALAYNKIWIRRKAFNVVFNTILNWSILTCVYLQFIDLNLWLVFLIGIPVQASIIASTYLKSDRYK